MTDLLEQISTTPWMADMLADQFDFDLERVDPVEDVRLATGEPLTPIAGDASGGTYLITPSGAVVYAGSEGEGGLVALTLRDALGLVVGLPSLHDALARPLGDDLQIWLDEIDDQMREDDVLMGEDSRALDERRRALREALDLPVGRDALAELHAAAADDAYRPISVHGPYTSMLG